MGRVQKNLKTIMNLTPTGRVLNSELRNFTTIVNLSTLIWMEHWPEEGYRDVGKLCLDLPDLPCKDEIIK